MSVVRLNVLLPLVRFDSPGQELLGTLMTDPRVELDEFRWIAGNLPMKGRIPLKFFQYGF